LTTTPHGRIRGCSVTFNVDTSAGSCYTSALMWYNMHAVYTGDLLLLFTLWLTSGTGSRILKLTLLPIYSLLRLSTGIITGIPIRPNPPLWAARLTNRVWPKESIYNYQPPKVPAVVHGSVLMDPRDPAEFLERLYIKAKNPEQLVKSTALWHILYFQDILLSKPDHQSTEYTLTLSRSPMSHGDRVFNSYSLTLYHVRSLAQRRRRRCTMQAIGYPCQSLLQRTSQSQSRRYLCH